MHIRQATQSDTEALVRVIDRAYEIYKIELPDLPDVSSGVEDEIAEGNVWVAESGSVVGGVFLTFDGTEAVLTNIAVDPIRSGEGIGKALIAHAEAECKKRGVLTLKLATHVKMPENVALYSHLGWVETGREGNKVYMSKQL